MSISDDKKILEDGKNNWKTKKMSNLEVSNSFLRNAFKYDILEKTFISLSERLISCGEYLEFKQLEDGSKKLNKAFFCKNRLCPMCVWRRSKKIFAQVSKIVSEIDKLDKYDYIFLTLTVKNCSRDELDDNIKLISNAFRRMLNKDKDIKPVCKGYFRGIEVTYNQETDTYHPHIHTIIVVNKSYFKSMDYIKTDKWAEIWQQYIKVDYEPIVDVRKVKGAKYKSVAEVSKYTVKEKDIIFYDEKGQVNEKLTDDNIYTLYFSLKNKRLVSFGGIMKNLHKKLNLEDMNSDNIDLIKTDVDDKDELLNYIILKYKWNVGYSNYLLVEDQ